MDSTKTSRNIRDELNSAIQRLGISVKLMAEDTGQSPQLITNNRHTTDASPASAVRDADYLQDYQFSNQMAAVFFQAIQMFNTEDWAPQFRNAPFATLDAIDDQRKIVVDLRHKAKHFMRDIPYEEWSHDQKKTAENYTDSMVRLVSMVLLFIGQFEEVSHQDALKAVRNSNKHTKLGGKSKWLKF